MNEQLQKIKSWFKKPTSSEFSYERRGMNPSKDWKKFLISTFVIVVILIGGALYFYMEISRGNLFTVSENPEENEVKINNVLLRKTIDDIHFREQTTAEVKENSQNPSDPSI